ncbi:ubiquinone anaerobic biosynthesis protein UbiV [Afifella marina]|uniref:Ubiquinone biosynthesis protein UbiV n=1 Tax=Afifella marina DSM 2698 TaxID=1120955 RepID=A0A1G5PAN8_AFIMA|nr:U32 family peptidase [Afifella marina]MBK1624388.1 U32 family peptidase [Afifella marina DSM 2698]MBK1628120.1 U32 family peptidase [Afifella marina]MBK5916554.1 U32 family peptidase [Afifella marina]RAI18923.1 U32 family peptidase [Afifella marina DSM 2698]SCZ46141.1 Collagenase-like protease, PrtC family [Afifella marina DSM 2698]
MAGQALLKLGPVLFNWPVEKWADFYARIADEAPVDRVCLGEVVCSKRLPFYNDVISEAVERLEAAGKEVVLSSLALITLPRERKAGAGLAKDEEHVIEVNDLTMLRYLEPGRKIAVGPLVNVYNEGTLSWLAGRGAKHVCLPPELPIASVESLAKAGSALDLDTEVWAFGRVPLAISGRCYHARIHKVSKDSCQFVCGLDADGLPVKTLDGGDFLAINGVQTLSFAYGSALGELDILMQAGVNSFRLSPHDCDMVAVAELYRQRLDRKISGDEAQAKLAELLPEAEFANGFLFGDYGAEMVKKAERQVA